MWAHATIRGTAPKHDCRFPVATCYTHSVIWGSIFLQIDCIARSETTKDSPFTGDLPKPATVNKHCHAFRRKARCELHHKHRASVPK